MFLAELTKFLPFVLHLTASPTEHKSMAIFIMAGLIVADE